MTLFIIFEDKKLVVNGEFRHKEPGCGIWSDSFDIISILYQGVDVADEYYSEYYDQYEKIVDLCVKGYEEQQQCNWEIANV